MAEVFNVNRNVARVPLGSSGLRLHAPGLKATIIWRPAAEHAALLARPVPPGMAAAAPPDQLEQAIADAGLEDQGSLNIETEAGSAETVAPPGTPPNKAVIGTTLAPNQVQFAIYRDESGVISLHAPIPLPRPAAPLMAAAAAGQPAAVAPTHHYIIPLRSAPGPAALAAAPGAAAAPRVAMLGGLLGKVIRFVGRKVLGSVEGEAVYLAAKLWEDQSRKAQGFNGGTVQQLLAATPTPFTGFASLKDQLSLLFIHGTTSTTAGAFAGLSQFPAVSQQLYAKYQNRVIGFNHHTLTKRVAQNAIDFLSDPSIPAGNYQFDVITHSRGGLVARALKELSSQALGQLADQTFTPPPGVNIQFNKVLLIGAPDVGTPLADPNDLPQAVSRLTSILSSFSQFVADLGLGALLAIFGGFVEDGIGALPGLEDMDPGSPFLTTLNDPPPSNASYFAVEAVYQPAGGLAKAIENNGVDALFLGQQNDLVVPTLGVSQVKGQTLPAQQVNEYGPSSDVYHLNYFYQQQTWDRVLAFL
jgi:hypothetical protein